MMATRAEGAVIDFKRLLALVAALVVGVFLWDSRFVYPLKLLVVLFHEAGHAIAAKAVGGEVLSITIDQMQGGLCRFQYEPTLINKIVTGSAGYLGSALSGSLLLFITLKRESAGRFVLGLLSVCLVVVCAFWGRSLFTLATGLGLAAVLGAGARWLPAAAAQALALFLGAFNGLYALFDLKDDLWSAARRGGSDAGMLAEATGIPSIVWAVAWSVIAVAMLGAALHFGLKRRKPMTRTLQMPVNLPH